MERTFQTEGMGVRDPRQAQAWQIFRRRKNAGEVQVERGRRR